MDANQRASKLNLVEQEIPRLRRFARFLTRDAEHADDVVQECLLRAVDKIDSWQAGTNLRAWLFTILKNILRNESRSHGRFVATDPQTEHGDLTVLVPAGQEAHMALLEVNEAFLKLSDEHREVLLLVAIDGLKYEEASVVLGLPVGTIRSRLSRARHELNCKIDGHPAQAQDTSRAGSGRDQRA
ncbi:MAG: sigma-70 family RNA polymerase sigma factor [Dichotomicrobium sp.]